MTKQQRDRLQALCTSYDVQFRESDYLELSDLPPGWVQGWVGGPEHAVGGPLKQTIYVGVSPEGDSHS